MDRRTALKFGTGATAALGFAPESLLRTASVSASRRMTCGLGMERPVSMKLRWRGEMPVSNARAS